MVVMTFYYYQAVSFVRVMSNLAFDMQPKDSPTG